MEVSVRKLKDQLSRYLRVVAQGDAVVITSHNKPVATLSPVTRADDPGLQRLLSTGRVQWNGKRLRIDPKRPVIKIKGKTASEIVIEDRG